MATRRKLAKTTQTDPFGGEQEVLAMVTINGKIEAVPQPEEPGQFGYHIIAPFPDPPTTTPQPAPAWWADYQAALNCTGFAATEPAAATTPSSIPIGSVFTPTYTGDHAVTFTAAITGGSPTAAALWVGTTPFADDTFNGSADPITPSSPTKTYTISFTAGVGYYFVADPENGTTSSNHSITVDCPYGI